MSEMIYPDTFDRRQACALAPALRMLYMRAARSKSAFAVFCAESSEQSPENGVLRLEPDADLAAEFGSFAEANGAPPDIAVVAGLGAFALGTTVDAAERARLMYLGEPAPSASQPVKSGRLAGKIAIVTGSAQGFGRGIAQAMAENGAHLVVADLNEAGAKTAAEELNAEFGAGTAVAVAANVADEDSVRAMVEAAVLRFGGLDALVSNAGIAIAGSLPEMTKQKFELVTSVNYTGYFLCAKYACEPMKIQRSYNPAYTADIIEINSKSGLEGSNKNFAYAGSKFGGVGLTQSFALELVEYGVKVNAICPGNLLDGPLWSDPEKGLFRQYFEAGKVPGAKSIADVRRFYESKVPMNRGCTTGDVACAILYCIEQQYETGQAIPVTGGQIMLK